MSISFKYGLGYIPGFIPAQLTTSTQTQSICVKVYPLFYKKNIVDWKVPATWGSCSFNVYKSDTGEAPWSKLNPTPITNTNFLEDFDVQDFSIYHKSFYTVEASVGSMGGRYVISNPATWVHKRSNLIEIRATEIQRRETVLLDKFTGVDTLIFRRIYSGVRCPNCYNEQIEKVTKDNCPICLDVGFVGGYFPGIKTKACYEISPNKVELTYLGKLETNRTSCWTISYPEVMTHDIIVRMPDFKVFRVEEVSSTELQTVKVRQIIQLIELDKDRVEMALLDNLAPPPKLTGNRSNCSVGILV